MPETGNKSPYRFNPRTYIRYDIMEPIINSQVPGFNPRTYIRYDNVKKWVRSYQLGFNPRTYIRYDLSGCGNHPDGMVSIHVPI